jgi:mono/diheme cytochrome c family protein
MGRKWGWFAVPLVASACFGWSCARVEAQETTSSVLDGVFTDAQATRGAETFAVACTACHGSSLSGLGEAPALVGAMFVSDFNGLTLGELFDRIRTTMPLNDPGVLTREQYADILAFVLKSNGYPAGQKDLSRRSEFLNTIRFEPPREGAAR